RVEALDALGGRRGKLAAVPRVAVVVEDDLPVEVFEAWHGSDPQSSLDSEQSVGLAERLVESVDVGFTVVQVDGRPGRCPDAAAPHQRLGAVVTGPHAHGGLVEHL